MSDYYDSEEIEVVTRYRMNYKRGSGTARLDAVDAIRVSESTAQVRTGLKEDPWLRIGEGRNKYAMPNPDGRLREAYDRLYRSAWGSHIGELDRNDVRLVLILAQGYLDLTTYALGQECCVGKLRDIWRTRRARRDQGESLVCSVPGGDGE